jgi:hypothetical protein
MPINVIGFAVAKVEADKHGVGDQEATRIGVIGSVMPNPIMALVVARSMADREAPAQATSTQASLDITLTPPKPPPPTDSTGAGTTGGTGTPGGTGTTGGTGTPGTSTGTASPEILLHIDQAKAVAQEAKISADQAKAAADDANRALTSLSGKVDEGFKRIEDKLATAASSPPSQGSTGAPNPPPPPGPRMKGQSG